MGRPELCLPGECPIFRLLPSDWREITGLNPPAPLHQLSVGLREQANAQIEILRGELKCNLHWAQQYWNLSVKNFIQGSVP